MFFKDQIVFFNDSLAPIEADILLLFSLKSKRYKRIAGKSSQYL